VGHAAAGHVTTRPGPRPTVSAVDLHGYIVKLSLGLTGDCVVHLASNGQLNHEGRGQSCIGIKNVLRTGFYPIHSSDSSLQTEL